MEERKWRLGEDLFTSDNLLDGISFNEIILQVHCNCRCINPKTVTKEVKDLLDQRLEDMQELLKRNMDVIITEARKGREA